MAEKQATPPKKRGPVKWGRIFATLIVLGLAGAGLYVASWLNARRFFLIVGPTDVRIAKGRMLPIGHEPFIPREAELRRAYETFPLPAGINLPRGETTFTDRVELDQALFRVLKDCIGFTLSRDERATPVMVAKYLSQIRAVPGTNVSQQIELAALERDAAYVTARHRFDEAIAALKDSARLFRESVRGAAAGAGDGELRARQIEGAIETLVAKDATRHEETRSRDASPSTALTATTATTAAHR